jgi:hypothetical protein
LNTPLQVPVSLHIFNRPDSTRKVFEQIRKARPSRLFVTADGPRAERPEDQEKCAQARSIIDDVDWVCELTTFFSETNNGSFKSTSTGISRVFEQVDRAIVLEDDCIPHETFFHFCNELLDYYENDRRVALIAGNNLLPAGKYTTDSYYFSRYTHMWGWATWRRTWEQIDFSMNNWPAFREMGGLRTCFDRRHEIAYWDDIMQGMYEGRTGPHWDYLLILSMCMNNSLAVKPAVNLITNTGFGDDATHFSYKMRVHDMERGEINFPLRHPPFICRHPRADDHMESRIFSRGTSEYMLRKFASLLPEPVFSVLQNMKRSLIGRKR